MSLEEPIKALAKWAETNWSQVLAARESCSATTEENAS
jgi:hypothetical protein